MIVLALDIATRTGIAVGEPNGTPKCWSEDLGKGLSEDRRFSNVLALTHRLIVEYSPELIGVEAAVGGRDANAYLIGLVACVRGCAANRRIPVESCHSGSVRKHFLKRAYTSKDFPHLSKPKAKLAIKEMVATRCRGLGWTVPDLDAADAAATWDYTCSVHVKGYQAKPVGGLFQ